MATKSISSVEKYTIRQLRKDLDITLAELSRQVGLKGKASAWEMERTNRCSPDVALALERLSRGRLDASDLNDIIARARETAKAA